LSKAQNDDDKIGIIPKHKYIDELEVEVARWLRITEDHPHFFTNEIKHVRAKMPADLSPTQQKIWRREEIRRCKEGYNGMCGKMYFFFNYCFIKNISGGKIPPDFRVCDNAWFKEIETCHENNEGLICVKRRRVGASWKEAADVIHDAIFKPFYIIGMNSKGERDSKSLFQKVKFVYDNLPDFLRVRVMSNTQMYMEFAYIDPKTKQKKGNQSEIIVVAPVPTAFECQMLNKWICDEAGKQPELPQMWSYTEDCMMEETVRKGIPILFGTSGDIGREGRGLVEMWRDAEIHRLRKFFFAGWMGILCDEYGNDRKEEAIRYIIYERHRRRNLSAKALNDFIQRYPLTVDEAFQQASTGGVGDIVKINSQRAALRENPPKIKRGRFGTDKDGNVKFIPDPFGEAIVYVEPEAHRHGLYVAGCDPADHDDVFEEASDLSMYIMKKSDGADPPMIVFEYTARPANLVQYYEQAMLALTYYNNARVFVEDNRYRFIGYFKENGYGYLLQTAPQSYIRVFGGKPNKIGFHKGTATADYMEELITEYIDDYVGFIPSDELLNECIQYGSRNTDRVIAFAAALMVLKEDRRKIRTVVGGRQNYTPTYGYKRTITGQIVRVDDIRSDENAALESEMQRWTMARPK
jgi:hypothetical protein